MPHTAALDRLLALPRVRLALLPTPLHRLDRFSEAIGVEVWCKRDDIGAPGLAGNKVRKFELVLAAAQAAGADTLITTGAAQSNSARTGAAAAAALGLRCVLVLTGAPPPERRANLLLDELFGADVRFAGPVGWEELGPILEAVAAEERAAGRNPFIAPVGASSPLGALGFALGYLEVVEQLEQGSAGGPAPAPGPDAVRALVHTTTSGGTHAGLVVGRALLGRGPRVIGIDAGRVLTEPAAGLAALATAAAAEVGAARTFDEAEIDVRLEHAGPAYGAVTDEAVAAIRLLSRTEGIVCDPVYSGKGLAGLVAMARSGELDGGPVLFWHTGGWHAVFDPHYGDPLLEQR
ncbi:MAG: 1-aminocyclopropane-1-carboxylate deaminase/D-cysteine desulfhydrase [Acidimicrobiia bacterium]